MMSRWFQSRTSRERWLVVAFIWSAALLWSFLGADRLRTGWHYLSLARKEAGLRGEIEAKLQAARMRAANAPQHSASAPMDLSASLAIAAGPMRLTSEPTISPGLARWTLSAEDLPVVTVVEVYRRVRALGGNVQVTEASLAAATEGHVDCRLTVQAWWPVP